MRGELGARLNVVFDVFRNRIAVLEGNALGPVGSKNRSRLGTWRNGSIARVVVRGICDPLGRDAVGINVEAMFRGAP